MFLNFGFKSVTMDDIAKELGISKKTIYKYFGNKEELVDESTEYVHVQINNIITSITSKGYNPIKENFEIKKMFKELFKNSKTSPMYQLKKYYPKTYAKLIDREWCMFSDCVQSNLTRGIEEKLYRAELDIDVVSRFYFSIVFGIHEEDYHNHEKYDLAQLEEAALEYHTRAIATEEGLKVLIEQLNNLNKDA
nr:TetR/AcrR family transcriptional regulator [Aureivirga marina]